jgi:hypothetical protein
MIRQWKLHRQAGRQAGMCIGILKRYSILHSESHNGNTATLHMT